VAQAEAGARLVLARPKTAQAEAYAAKFETKSMALSSTSLDKSRYSLNELAPNSKPSVDGKVRLICEE